jgi:pre-mRNA-splicing factor 18|tara:strand:- start:74 stop:700 length:627 start_codon:yes stop_codon:yes gene_type:complete
MDLLKAEIERKRSASAALGGNTAVGGKKKWVKKGDLEKARVAQYHEGKAEDDKARQTSSDARFDAGPPIVDGTDSGGGAVASQATSAGGAGSSTEDIRPNDVKRRLRMLGQPIQLFDEDDAARLERYRAVSSALPTESEVDRSDLKKGQMFNETQLYDDKGGAMQEGVQEDVEGAAESYKDDEELTATFVPTTPEQIVSRHFKELMQM